MSGRSTPRIPAGKTSNDLNTPRGGRNLAGGKHIVSEVNSVIKGTSNLPKENSFVHFHIKRRIMPNSKESVIVPINLPTPVRSRPTTTDGCAPSARSRSAEPFTIGGKTFDVPDRRCVKPVASPKRREIMPRPILERPSQMSQIVQVDSPSRAPMIPLARTGKHIERQQPPKQDVEDGTTKRFTRPPYWDEQARAPPGAAFSKPTRAFQAPAVADPEKALMSPRRISGMKKNESVVADCFPSSRGGTPVRRTKELLLDHNGHFSKGFDDAFGRKRCQTPQPIERTRVRAPTLSNAGTNVFRIHPNMDHAGKGTFGHERKSKNNEALFFGGNFDTRSTRRLDLPVGKSVSAARRSSSAPADAFRRSNTSSSSSVASLIEAPFDRTTNAGKYEPTFESRQTCRKFQPYVRPMLKVSNKPPVIAAAVG